MRLVEGLRTGMMEIRSHKMRSFLSFVGVLVGVGSVMLTLAMLAGLDAKMSKAIELAGPGRMTLTENNNYRSDKKLSKGLTLEDVYAIRTHMPELVYVEPQISEWGLPFVLEDFRERVHVGGATPEKRKRDWVYTVRGRFFTEEDLERHARICVLVRPGPRTADKYAKFFTWWQDPFDAVFDKKEPLGKTVRLGRTYLTVVGILQEPPRDKDPRMWRSWSPKVLVPLTTLQKYYRGDTKLNEIEVDTGDASTVAAAETRLRQVMTTLHRGEEDFQIQKLGEFMAERAREQRRAQAVFLAIGIVALLSGGIGIMNVSLATVYSRIREIGIRRAVGATRADVLGQFVTEATLLAVVGGMAGILAGLAGAWALPRFSQEIEVQLRWSSALLCLGISAVVGLVFSVYPAWQASRLDPVEALRYE